MGNILVAVYGSLKRAYGNNRLLEGSEFLGTTQTSPDFTMYSLGAFPCIVTGGSTSIEIEVYSVDEFTLARLDLLEGYPRFYNRMKIETEYGEAWVYFIENLEYTGHEAIVEGGVW